MVEVTKNLANRHQCLKWMYQQGATGFVQRDVISKFHVPTTFLAACAKKNILKANINGTKYIGPEPDVKLAVELFDFENQRRGKNIPKFPKKMVGIESQSSKKSLDEILEENSTTNLDKIIPKQVSTKQNEFILPLELSVKDSKITLDWKDFNKLVEVYGTND
jgi:hypothetical protein